MQSIEKKEGNDVWQELGDHGARLTNLETKDAQNQQWQVNHRAETFGMIKELKDDFYEIVRPLVEDVSSIKGYLKYGLGYGMGIIGTILVLLEMYRTFK